MLDEDRVREAVEIQSRCYGLLGWVVDAIERGFIHLLAAHEYAGVSEAAEVWILRHHEDLPREVRPLSKEQPHLRRFASYFASYLTTSFDLIPNPQPRLVSGCGCTCPWCSHFEPGSHLRAKKVMNKDKKLADRLERDCLEQMALDVGGTAPGRVDELLGAAEWKQRVSLVTHAEELLRRCDDRGFGPVALALWRRIAWKPEGSPKKKFRLDADRILEAQAEIAEALRAPPAD